MWLVCVSLFSNRFGQHLDNTAFGFSKSCSSTVLVRLALVVAALLTPCLIIGKISDVYNTHNSLRYSSLVRVCLCGSISRATMCTVYIVSLTVSLGSDYFVYLTCHDGGYVLICS